MTEQPDTKTIILRKPIELGGQTYAVLDLREPMAGEIKRAQVSTGDMDSNISLVSIISGIPPQAIEKVGIRDMTEAVEYLRGFTVVAPQTGSSS